MAPKDCFLGAVRRRTMICCRKVKISASIAARDRNRSATAHTMSLTRSLIADQHRPILGQPPANRFAAGTTCPDQVRLAVNVSPVQFRSQTLALKVAAALAASGLSVNRLELEITEAVLIRDDEAALDMLHQLRAIGVRIALDDFGTGYSSLNYLPRFPFDKIKIDRSFINDLTDIDGSSSIVQAVVNIAVARNMTTTAEGVETQQQLDLLRSLGCNQMQGYLFSAARPPGEIQKFFRSCERTDQAVA